jgi:hypothetical protein
MLMAMSQRHETVSGDIWISTIPSALIHRLTAKTPDQVYFNQRPQLNSAA